MEKLTITIEISEDIKASIENIINKTNTTYNKVIEKAVNSYFTGTATVVVRNNA